MFFRQHTIETAQKLGVVGWVKNTQGTTVANAAGAAGLDATCCCRRHCDRRGTRQRPSNFRVQGDSALTTVNCLQQHAGVHLMRLPCICRSTCKPRAVPRLKLTKLTSKMSISWTNRPSASLNLADAMQQWQGKASLPSFAKLSSASQHFPLVMLLQEAKFD